MQRVVLAPAGIPDDRFAKLEMAFTEMKGDKTYQRLMTRLGENTDLMLGADYEKVRAKQSEDYAALVKAITQ